MDIGGLGSHSNVSSCIGSHRELDDEEALKWAALERLPTYQRARKGLLHGVAGEFREVDLHQLGFQEKELLDKVIGDVHDNEAFLKRLKKRIDRYLFSPFNSNHDIIMLF